MKIGGNNPTPVSQTGYEVQESLLELLTREDTLVKQLNTANHALVIASKTSTRLTEYRSNIKTLTAKLEAARRDIQMYCMNTLGISISGMINIEEKKTGQAYVRREQMIASLYDE